MTSSRRSAERAADSSGRIAVALPVTDARIPSAAGGRKAPHRDGTRRGYGRWRAVTLIAVHVLAAVHILHWQLSGRTLAPLELSETMYTLELGIVTLGFLLMIALVLGTLLFGRFFCAWGCHIIALQDLCAWLLRKIGIRPKPIRSRVLLLVPGIAALYLFVWPQVARWIDGRTLVVPRIAAEVRGASSSFLTTDFWRQMPGWWIGGLTLFTCGFAVVYVLGSRSFCHYGCPYGAVFALTDRFAVGSIRVTEDCAQCGMCTAACPQGIRVHREVKMHGMVVNSACMKDLDCIAACPNHALYFGFGKPALFKSWKGGGRFGVPYDFSFAEDILMGVVFVAILLIFRGLYGAVPFLLTLALAAMIAYLTVVATRLGTHANVRAATWTLKRRGRVTGRGRAYAVFFAALVTLVSHSAFIRYHAFCGLRYAAAIAEHADDDRAEENAALAFAHLTAADTWGLFRNARVERGLMTASLRLRWFDSAIGYARRLLERDARDARARLNLAEAYAANQQPTKAESELRAVLTQPGAAGPIRVAACQKLGRLLAARRDFAGAAGALRAGLALDPEKASLHADLGGVLAELGQVDEAEARLKEAVRRDPQIPRAQYNLGSLLAHQDRFEEAAAAYAQALAAGADDDAIHNNLGYVLYRSGHLEQARRHLERALALDPTRAGTHFNLANVLASQRKMQPAAEHYRTAARLDPRYAEPDHVLTR